MHPCRIVRFSLEVRSEPLSDREVIGFLFADFYEQSGDKVAVDTASISIDAG